MELRLRPAQFNGPIGALGAYHINCVNDDLYPFRSCTRSIDIRLFAQAPQLKAFALDGFFDFGAREFVWRSLVCSHDARHRPRTMLRWQFASARIPCEGMQFPPGLGFENIDAHGSSFMQRPRNMSGARHSLPSGLSVDAKCG